MNAPQGGRLGANFLAVNCAWPGVGASGGVAAVKSGAEPRTRIDGLLDPSAFARAYFAAGILAYEGILACHVALGSAFLSGGRPACSQRPETATRRPARVARQQGAVGACGLI
jgi:hypothetical protein